MGQQQQQKKQSQQNSEMEQKYHRLQKQEQKLNMEEKKLSIMREKIQLEHQFIRQERKAQRKRNTVTTLQLQKEWQQEITTFHNHMKLQKQEYVDKLRNSNNEIVKLKRENQNQIDRLKEVWDEKESNYQKEKIELRKQLLQKEKQQQQQQQQQQQRNYNDNDDNNNKNNKEREKVRNEIKCLKDQLILKQSSYEILEMKLLDLQRDQGRKREENSIALSKVCQDRDRYQKLVQQLEEKYRSVQIKSEDTVNQHKRQMMQKEKQNN